MPSNLIKKIVTDETAVGKELSKFIADAAKEAIKAKGSFNIGLSGGSMSKFVCNGLPGMGTELDKWKFFFCDERLVPLTAEDCTFKVYWEGLKDKTSLKKEQFIIINPDLDVKAAATDYEEKVRKHFPDCALPKFDVLLLGMGPDGHTASLFPGHPLLKETSVWIAPISDSPKPPPCRVTMTFPVINNAAACVFAMAGQGKADMVKRVLGDGEKLPAALVQPTDGKLVWILDEPAASKL